jgi:Rrf2 family protein
VDNGRVKVSAKADYAVRAAVELGLERGEDPPRPVKGDHVAKAQEIPIKFLENILLDLRQAGLVNSRRGPEGGYWLSRPPEEITVADVIRAADGPLASVRGEKPEDLHYLGASESLATVWIALRSSLREVLEQVTLADVAAGKLPDAVTSRSGDPDAWRRR